VRRFVESNRPSWERLIALLEAASHDGLRTFSADQLDELATLHRRATSDLAQARTRGYDPRLVAYLNELVGRSAGLIYGGRRRRRFDLGKFFFEEVPYTFRRTLRFTAIAFAVCAAASVVAYQAAATNPAWADALFSPSLRHVVEEFLAKEKPSGTYFQDTQSMLGADNLSGIIASNNLQVALKAFALGITAGLGTLYVLVTTGLMLGGFVGVGTYHDRTADLIAIVAPHGVLELSAIFICAGAGLMMGWALVDPGDRLRVEALAAAAREAVTLVLACVPIFLIAAAIEGFISPQSKGLLQANEPRILFGLMTGLLLVLYLFFGDRLRWRRSEGRV